MSISQTEIKKGNNNIGHWHGGWSSCRFHKKTKHPAATNLCSTLFFLFFLGGQKKNCACEHFQEADMDIKPIPLDVRTPAEIIQPSIFYHRFPFSQRPVGMLQSIPAVWGPRRGYTLDKSSVQCGASRRDTPALALTDHFKLPVSLMRMSLGCWLENLESQRRRQKKQRHGSNSAPTAKAAPAQLSLIIHSEKCGTMTVSKERTGRIMGNRGFIHWLGGVGGVGQRRMAGWWTGGPMRENTGRVRKKWRGKK